jgi:hypothetical protein
MSITLNKDYEKGVIIAQAGSDSQSIDIPFVPNFVRVKFEGPQLTRKDDVLGEDAVYWNLVNITPTSYRLDITWSVYSQRREIHYQVAILQVDPAAAV